MKFGKVDLGGLKKLQQKLNAVKQAEMNQFLTDCAKAIAARLLREVIRKTPVGNYKIEVEVTAKKDSKYHKKGDTYKKKVNPTGRVGGTLRRGWTAKTQEEAEGGTGSGASSIDDFLSGIKVIHEGKVFKIELINPVEYASYVEYGHRQTPGRYVPAIGKRLKAAWVPGKHMLAISEDYVKGIAPELLAQRLKTFLEGYFS